MLYARYTYRTCIVSVKWVYVRHFASESIVCPSPSIYECSLSTKSSIVLSYNRVKQLLGHLPSWLQQTWCSLHTATLLLVGGNSNSINSQLPSSVKTSSAMEYASWGSHHPRYNYGGLRWSPSLYETSPKIKGTKLRILSYKAPALTVVCQC